MAASMVVAASLVLGIGARGSGAAGAAEVTDLGTLGGATARALAINGAGQVTGDSETASGQSHAFSWTKERGMIDLGVLPGATGSTPEAISQSGQIVGYSRVGDMYHAFSWTRADGIVDLGTLGVDSIASAVNDAGQVVGNGFVAPGLRHAFSWTASGGMVDIGASIATAAYPDSFATGVNSGGTVIAFDFRNGNGSAGRAVTWTASGGVVDLGSLGGGYSYPTAVNDDGWVVGRGTTASGATHAFLWRPGSGITDLGTLGGSYSTAAVVNDSGWVAGTSSTASGARRVFLWTQSDGMVDAGDLGDPSGGRIDNQMVVTALSNTGQIVGYGPNPAGTACAFSWTHSSGIVNLNRFMATDVDDSGRVVGYGPQSSEGGRRALLWPAVVPDGAITGTVTGHDGRPLAGVWVSATPLFFAGFGAHQATTASDGTYTIPTSAGTYQVRFTKQTYVSEIYNNQLTSDAATAVSVSGPAATTGIDAQLDVGGSISGTVRDASGAPVASASVSADRIGGGSWSASTGADGSYTIVELRAGAYRVSAIGGSYARQFHGGGTTSGSGTPVQLATGQTRGTIDVSLSLLAGSISGTLTGSTGSPGAGWVTATPTDPGLSARRAQAGVTGDGSYTITGLTPGRYTVYFEYWYGSPNEYYNHVRTAGMATEVTVVSATTTAAIDGRFTASGAVTGIVTDSGGTPVAGIQVTASSADGDTGVSTTGAEGRYRIADLHPGSYVLGFHDPSGRHPDEWFDDAPSRAAATAVTVAERATTGEVDAQLGLEPAPAPPGAPTAVTASAGDGRATVSFSPPASDGGAAIVSYTVTAAPGGAETTGSGSPITIGGLTNGTTYTFAVVARNSIGTSPASTPSNAVTPTAPSPPPPSPPVPSPPPATPGSSDPGQPNLIVTLSASVTGVQVNGSSDFTVVVGNTGTQTGNGVELTITLPAGATLLGPPAYDRGAGCTGSGPIACNLDFLPVGVSSTVRFSSAFGAAGAHVVSVRASSDEPDLAPADDTASVTVTVAAPAPAPTVPAPAPKIVKPVLAAIKLVPAKPVAGKQATATMLVRRSDTGRLLASGRMICDPSVSGKVIRHVESFRGGIAKLAFTVPKSAKGKKLQVKVTIRLGNQAATRIAVVRVA